MAKTHVFDRFPEMREAVEACMAADTYAFDLETVGHGPGGSSFNPYVGRITGFSVAVDTILVPSKCWHKCCKPEVMVPKAWYFNFLPEFQTEISYAEAAEKHSNECVPYIETWKAFAELRAQKDKKCVMHNGKFDLLFKIHGKMDVLNQVVDTAIASWMVDENKGNNKLKFNVGKFLKHSMVEFKELGGLFSPPIEGYGADDACQTLRLWRYFQPLLEREGLMKVFLELMCEMPLILAHMEHRGIMLDPTVLEDLRSEVDPAIKQAEKDCHMLAGAAYIKAHPDIPAEQKKKLKKEGLEFMVTSPAVVGEMLFKTLKWKQRGDIKRTKTKGKDGTFGYSTGKEVLGRYEKDRPLAQAVLKHRELSKLESTYIDPLLKAHDLIDGRIRSRFNQLAHPQGGGGTVTGRLSSSKSVLGGAQLQNIPSRSKLGKRVRDAFVAAPGKMLVVYDYSQVELRFMAHFSRDPTLLAAYRNWDCSECGKSGSTGIALLSCPECSAAPGHRKNESKDGCVECGDVDWDKPDAHHGFCLGLDIHQITADVCGVNRYIGKIVNFALLYGLGAKGLARDLKISIGLAKKIRGAYFDNYKGITKHNYWVATEIMKYGRIKTVLKRVRHFPQCKGRRVELWDREWRQAANSIIQGSAADLMMVGMRNIYRRLVREGLDDECGLVLQVHDEVTVECPAHLAPYICTLVREEMENAFRIRVPVVSEGCAAASWGLAK
jgi:DNA polymerase-1